MSFQKALELVLGFEGGYANDPKDHGGPTNFGITQGTLNEFNSAYRIPHYSVKDITRDKAIEIYKRNYWLDGKCDLIDNINSSLSIIHFDHCVNAGIDQAARDLQRSVETKVDGQIGPITLACIKHTDQKQACINYLNNRVIFYTKIILHHPDQAKFKNSWFHRLSSLSNHLNLGWVNK